MQKLRAVTSYNANGLLPVTLDYATNAVTNLSFGNGAALTFANADAGAGTGTRRQSMASDC